MSETTQDRQTLRRGDAVKLVFFAVRHLLGFAFFLWLAAEMRRRTEGWLWLAVGLLGLGYFAFAAYMWTRLRTHYRRRRWR